ncbi:MAG: fumarylacetoacetate hydrolase family protein [Planctomycetes bacterium]|nr:fumarylacetoacetate hydrolase family protein [Planctomycetota bacterium]NOG54012.1 fumarylacetoacetate hydrolase family protein [Planctomycetota bacterium]
MGIGMNYRQHALEQGKQPPTRPMMFMKNPAAACGPHDDIVIAPVCAEREQVDYECELAVIIGRPARDVAQDQALSYVLGYTAANDVSARWWQKEAGGGQFCRGKSFDTFCPMGPCLVTPDEVPDPQALRLTTTLNGEVMQDSNTGDMIFNVAELIAFLSQGTTLMPGTVILTGTPSGVGFARTPPVWLKDGDVVECQVEGIGAVCNRVMGDSAP